LADILGLVNKLEEAAETVGLGQSSSLSGLLNGDWELVCSPDDETRSSPFFWAFRKAFPDNSDQIFGIADSTPSPIKDVGPAKQHIELDADNVGGAGKLVSRVRVATLGGVATSMMTTRAAIMGVDGVDGLRLQIDATKPEDSTIVKLLTGPSHDTVNKQLPAFPSGQALEQAAPGSSTVTMRTTFCDDELRIGRNDERPNKDVFIWKRAGFVKTNVAQFVLCWPLWIHHLKNDSSHLSQDGRVSSLCLSNVHHNKWWNHFVKQGLTMRKSDKFQLFCLIQKQIPRTLQCVAVVIS